MTVLLATQVMTHFEVVDMDHSSAPGGSPPKGDPPSVGLLAVAVHLLMVVWPKDYDSPGDTNGDWVPSDRHPFGLPGHLGPQGPWGTSASHWLQDLQGLRRHPRQLDHSNLNANVLGISNSEWSLTQMSQTYMNVLSVQQVMTKSDKVHRHRSNILQLWKN